MTLKKVTICGGIKQIQYGKVFIYNININIKISLDVNLI
jgi:hypothetical protein